MHWLWLCCRYWNRYPGAMCDVESYTYMPLCEELGYVPTEKYAHQPELIAHSTATLSPHTPQGCDPIINLQ